MRIPAGQTIAVVLAVTLAGAATGVACTPGASGTGLADDPESYVPKEVDGRALGPPGEIARNFVAGFKDVSVSAAGEVSAAEANPAVPYPGAFVVAVASPTAAQQVRRTLEGGTRNAPARIRRKTIEGVQVDYYEIRQESVSAVLEFHVEDDLLVVVMSFEGRPLADHLMAAAIRAARRRGTAAPPARPPGARGRSGRALMSGRVVRLRAPAWVPRPAGPAVKPHVAVLAGPEATELPVPGSHWPARRAA